MTKRTLKVEPPVRLPPSDKPEERMKRVILKNQAR